MASSEEDVFDNEEYAQKRDCAIETVHRTTLKMTDDHLVSVIP